MSNETAIKLASVAVVYVAVNLYGRRLMAQERKRMMKEEPRVYNYSSLLHTS